MLATQARFSLFAVDQQQKGYLARQAVSVMLNGASVERFEAINSNGYDQTVVDNETLSSSAQRFSPDTAFGPGIDPTAQDDLGDFHTADITMDVEDCCPLQGLEDPHASPSRNQPLVDT